MKDEKCTVCDEAECICAQLPPHVKDLLIMQQHPAHKFFLWWWLCALLIFYIAAWQAGYSPWWLLKNVLLALELWHE